VSFAASKGPFVGSEALARQFEELNRLIKGQTDRSDLLPRLIRPVAVLDQGVARRGNEVVIGDRHVGVITSGTIVPYWKFSGSGSDIRITDENDRRSIAMALIDAGLQPDAEVQVIVRGVPLRSRIVRRHGRSDAAPYFRPILAATPPAVSRPTDPGANMLEGNFWGCSTFPECKGTRPI
jgi:aminomethyltransferase